MDAPFSLFQKSTVPPSPSGDRAGRHRSASGAQAGFCRPDGGRTAPPEAAPFRSRAAGGRRAHAGRGPRRASSTATGPRGVEPPGRPPGPRRPAVRVGGAGAGSASSPSYTAGNGFGHDTGDDVVDGQHHQPGARREGDRVGAEQRAQVEHRQHPATPVGDSGEPRRRTGHPGHLRAPTRPRRRRPSRRRSGRSPGAAGLPPARDPGHDDRPSRPAVSVASGLIGRIIGRPRPLL